MASTAFEADESDALVETDSSTAPRIAHLDDAFLVAVKPSGLLSVIGRTQPDCLAARVQASFPDALVVHRLDMATSGLMLFARGVAAQRLLSQAFAERRVDKRYVAVVDGLVDRDDGEIDLPLAADWPNRPRQQVDPVAGKPSLTRYSVLHRDPIARATRLALRPVTGRAHQLRVHLMAIGHPILGDALYGPPGARGDGPARAHRLLLHAAELGFVHPLSGARIVVRDDPPF